MMEYDDRMLDPWYFEIIDVYMLLKMDLESWQGPAVEKYLNFYLLHHLITKGKDNEQNT